MATPISSLVPRSFQSWPSPGITATPTDFYLDAGRYGLLATWTVGTATLQKLAPDGVTYLNVSAALAAPGAASAYSVYELPAGRYRMLLAGGIVGFIGEIAQIAPGRSGG
jgi:hypothetical protein